MSGNKCFVCTGEIQKGTYDGDNNSSEENSILLSKILELPDLEGDETKKFGGRKISYCHLCLNRILNIRDMLEELERLEKKVLDEKYSIELQLKENDKSQGQNSSDQLRGQIVTELRAASIGSMLHKIQKKRVGQRRDTKDSRNIRIMKNVTIPEVLSEKIQPISDDQLQSGNVEPTSQESQSQLVHQHSFPSNPYGSTRTNDHLDSQVEDTTSQESPTVNGNITEASWTFDNEECDIKYEVGHSDMTGDPLEPDLEPLNFTQQNDLFGQISTKLEVDNLPDVTWCEFSDAQQITVTEDRPMQKNFICGTCGAGFVSYNLLRTHDRKHLKNVKCKNSTVKNIRRKKGKSRQINRTPSMRPKKCEECGKVLSTNQKWTHHVMSFHRGQYKFKCTMCDYGCQMPSHLRAHMLTHSRTVNSEDVKCSKCDRVFKTKRARSVHMVKWHVTKLIK